MMMKKGTADGPKRQQYEPDNNLRMKRWWWWMDGSIDTDFYVLKKYLLHLSLY